MVSDFLTLRIPNAISIALAGLFLIEVFLLPVGVSWYSHFFSFGLVFVLGIVLFYFNIIGGGDAKFLAAVALWVGMDALPAFFIVVALCGGILAVVLLGVRIFTHRGLLTVGIRCLQPRQPVPYGVAIGAGALIFGYLSLPGTGVALG